MTAIQKKVGNFNSILTIMDRSLRQKINKETADLKNTIDQMALTNIYRTFHTIVAEYNFFSSAHEIFSRIDHMLDKKKCQQI